MPRLRAAVSKRLIAAPIAERVEARLARVVSVVVRAARAPMTVVRSSRGAAAIPPGEEDVVAFARRLERVLLRID